MAMTCELVDATAIETWEPERIQRLVFERHGLVVGAVFPLNERENYVNVAHMPEMVVPHVLVIPVGSDGRAEALAWAEKNFHSEVPA